MIYYYEQKDIEDFNNGDEVIVDGNLIYNSFFSKISISVNNIEKKGLSEEYLNFLKIKEEFLKKGYFDKDTKKTICDYPKDIGLITSDKSAAIVDFLSVINKEISDINIYLYPVKVQGLSAKDEIINAINVLDKKNLDAIVITRGGGSKEDLKVFNEKDIVEEIYKAKSPIISAIGHKIDLSLTDLVSDLSLQTPTEAGSYLVRNYKKIRQDINKIFIDIQKTLNRNIELKELKLNNLKYSLDSYSLDKLLDEKTNKLNSDLQGKIREVSDKVSTIDQKADGIKMEVSDTVRSFESKTKELDNSIKDKTEAISRNLNNKISSVTTNVSKIEQKANRIEISVAQKVSESDFTGRKMISKINLDK
ncbi:MAG: exodeoxyribonuclease VII large subunit, partial [Anaerococcus vaginalis]|nr:exodeoxyribonuclease VII large subunit [Anaerococcus vaginalis]